MTDITTGLGAAGLALVSPIIADMSAANLEPDARESALLREAGELRDRMAELQEAIEHDGLRRELKNGSVQLHPAVAEMRQHKVAMGKLLGAIAMVDTTGGAVKSARHQRAASARWAERTRG